MVESILESRRASRVGSMVGSILESRRASRVESMVGSILESMGVEGRQRIRG